MLYYRLKDETTTDSNALEKEELDRKTNHHGLMKVQMRNDLIKDFTDPLNKRIDDLTTQHHVLNQRVAQLESRQHVIVDEARRGQDRGETLRTEVIEMKRAVSRALTCLRAATMKEFDMITRLKTQAVDAYNDAHQEISLVQHIDKTVDVPVVMQDQVLASQTVQKTAEMPQVQFLDRILDVHVVPQRHVPFSSMSQEQIQKRIVEETTDIPVPHMMEKTIEFVKLLPQEQIQNRTMERIIDVPVLQIQETVEVPQVQFIDKAMDVPVVMQRQVPTVQKVQKTAEVPQVQFIDKVVDAPVIMKRQVPAIQVAQKTVKDPQTQPIVKELRSKFEVGHTNKVHARNQPDKNRWRKKQEFEATQYPQDVQERVDLTNQRQVPAIRSVQKTVEVPRVQYIDKVADIPVDMQRQVSTTQAAQDIEEVEDVHALTRSEVPNIPDDGLSRRARRGNFPCQPKQSSKVAQTNQTLIDSTTWSYRHLKERPSS